MRGRTRSTRRLIAALGVLALVTVFTFGVLHEYGHAAGHGSESCATCATARTPQATPPAMAMLIFVALLFLVVAMPVRVVARTNARLTRSTRAPPLS